MGCLNYSLMGICCSVPETHVQMSRPVTTRFSFCPVSLLYLLTLCLPCTCTCTNPLCATLFWGALELGRHFWKYFFQLLDLFTCKSYRKTKKAKLITHAHSANQKQWESLHWATRMNNRRVYNCANWRTWLLYGCADRRTWQTKS